MKLAAQKTPLPDPKQVFRKCENGAATHDVLGLAGEMSDGQPLLEPVMRNGARLPAGRRPLDEIRAHAERSLAMLPPRIRSLAPAAADYQVEISPALGEAAARTRRRLEQH